MDAVVNQSTVEFKGLLDEKSSMEKVRVAVEQALAASRDAIVRLDFSGVKRANSVGILAWAKFVDSAVERFIYVNAPEWLVEQFNLCDLLKNGAVVESVQAPFYCADTDGHETIVLIIGKDIPIQGDYSEFDLVMSSNSGAKLEADFEPHEYFHFIVRNLEKFQGAVK